MGDSGKRLGTAHRYVLVAAGSNSSGQLGIGHCEDAHTLRQTCRECDYSSGSKENSQGNGDERAVGTEAARDAEAACFPPRGWRIEQLSSGAAHTAALLASTAAGETATRLWVTGTCEQGQLGRLPRPPKGGQDVHRFQELDLHGLLGGGLGAPLASAAQSPKLVSCGWDWTLLALTPPSLQGTESVAVDDTLIALGTSNDFGQLGVGRGVSPGCTVHVVPIAQAVASYQRPGGRLRIDALACGVRHTLVSVTLEGHLRGGDATEQHFVCAWGAARHGQCGQTIGPGAATTSAKLQKSGSGAAVAWVPQLVRAYSSPAIRRNAGVTHRTEPPVIAVGKDHSLIRVPPSWMPVSSVEGGAGTGSSNASPSNGLAGLRFAFLGSNRHGQLDLQHEASSTAPAGVGVGQGVGLIDVGCMWNGTLAVLRNGGERILVGSGSGARGQLGCAPSSSEQGQGQGQEQEQERGEHGTIARVPLGAGAGAGQADRSDRGGTPQSKTKLACGSEHALFLAGNGTVLGWGWNEHGNLAQGAHDEHDRLAPTPVWPPPPAAASAASASASADGALHGAHATDVWAGCGSTFIQLSVPSSMLL